MKIAKQKIFMMIFYIGRLFETIKLYKFAIASFKISSFFCVDKSKKYRMYYKLGVNYEKIRNYQLSCLNYQSALKLNNQLSKLHFHLGYVLFKQGLLAAASESFKIAISIDPTIANWHFYLGYVNEKNLQWKMAAESYEKAVKLDPQWAKWFFRLGYMYEKCELWYKAAESYEKAVKLDPQWAKWLFRLGHAHEKDKQIKNAIKAYEDALNIESDQLSWHCHLWSAYYLIGDSEKALTLAYEYLQKNFFCLDFKRIQKIKKCFQNFKRVNENHKFLITRHQSVSQENNSQILAQAMMAFLLAVPSIMSKLLIHIESIDIDNNTLKRRFKALCPRMIGANDGIISGTFKVVVVIDNGADLRAVYDITKMYDHVICLFHRKNDIQYREKEILKELDSRCSLIFFDEVVTLKEEIKIAKFSDTIAYSLVKCISDVIGEGFIKQITEIFNEAFQLDVQNFLYSRIVQGIKIFGSIKKFEPDKVIFVIGEKLTYHRTFALLEKYGKNRIELIQAAKSYREDFGDICDFDCIGHENRTEWIKARDHLSKRICAIKAPKLNFKFTPVAVMANFNPFYFRSKMIVIPILESILKKTSCLAIQRNPLPNRAFFDVRKIFESIKNNSNREIYSWQGMNDLQNIAKEISNNELYIKFYKMLCETINLKKILFQTKDNYTLDEETLKFHMCNYFKQNFIYNVLQSTFALYFFANNAISSLLIVGDTRTIQSRSFTIAAQKYGALVFDYEFLFISNHPKYRKPISNYILASETYLAELYNKIYQIPKDRFFLVGTHMVSNRVNGAKCLDKLNERKAIAIKNDHKFLIVFVAQPLFNPTIRALTACVKACLQIPVNIVVKLHPSDKLSNKTEYEYLVNRLGAKDWVTILSDGNLTSMIVAADLVVTLYSNVGIEAAVLNRNVLSIQLEQEPFPIDLYEVGVAVKSKTEEELKHMIYDLLYDGKIADICKKRRLEYMSKNFQLYSGSVEERIAQIITNCDKLKSEYGSKFV